MTTPPIPFYKWLQVHKSILLADFLAHEATQNPAALLAVNARMQEVTRTPLTCHDDNMIAALSWMILARSYEIIDEHLHGQQKLEFYRRLASVAAPPNSDAFTSFQELKDSYRLCVTEFAEEQPNQYGETMWKFVKVLRDALSHVDYVFDSSGGKTADHERIILDHCYNNTVKLRMSCTVNDFFLFVRHMGVWMDTALQRLQFIQPSPDAK